MTKHRTKTRMKYDPRPGDALCYFNSEGDWCRLEVVAPGTHRTPEHFVQLTFESEGKR